MGRLTVLVIVFVTWQSHVSAESSDFSEIKEFLQVGGGVNITQISQARDGRNLGNSIEDATENFMKSNEVAMELPFGTTVTVSGRNLDNEEVDLKLRLGSGNEVQARKKSKVKKILAPILIVLLLKAITLIPLALGILGIKTWNALQLSFVSFVTSIVLAVWKLCAKFSDHHQAPHIVHESVHDVHVPHVYHESHHDHHHDPWDHHYHRSDDSPQQLAYNGYVPESKM
uniref:Protein osiris 19 n=1 Tax=Dendroctonus ponderosae TaxID=77166 RepID=A0AAR5P7A0_DENPD